MDKYPSMGDLEISPAKTGQYSLLTDPLLDVGLGLVIFWTTGMELPQKPMSLGVMCYALILQQWLMHMFSYTKKIKGKQRGNGLPRTAHCGSSLPNSGGDGG